jgi:hypothetical protein
MKTNGMSMRIFVTVLALGVSMLATTSLEAQQKPAGISRVGGWRSVAPVLGAPISMFSGAAWRN